MAKKEEKITKEVKSTVLISPVPIYQRDTGMALLKGLLKFCLSINYRDPIEINIKDNFQLELVYPIEVTPEEVDKLENDLASYIGEVTDLLNKLKFLEAAGLIQLKRKAPPKGKRQPPEGESQG